MAMTDKEYEAMDEKAENPQKDVFCPRCGGKLKYYEHGNSYEVKCETENCIKMTLRGL